MSCPTFSSKKKEWCNFIVCDNFVEFDGTHTLPTNNLAQLTVLHTSAKNMPSWNFPKVIAHRGGGTLAPENTLNAITLGALTYGLKAVEFDVMLSQDCVPFLMHDDILERTVRTTLHCGKSFGDVDSTEILKMDAGSWFDSSYGHVHIPTFESVLQYCIENEIWMNIEIKPVPGQEILTGRIVGETTAKYFPSSGSKNLPLFSSFSYDSLVVAKEFAPHIPRGYLIDCIDEVEDWKQRMITLGGVAVHVNHERLEPRHITDIKSAGFGLFCYTVNDIARGEHLFAEGVDAFCTDAVDIFSTLPPPISGSVATES